MQSRTFSSLSSVFFFIEDLSEIKLVQYMLAMLSESFFCVDKCVCDKWVCFSVGDALCHPVLEKLQTINKQEEFGADDLSQSLVWVSL